MPYIGNITSDFSIDTGNITNRAVTATKLSPSSVGSNGQVLSVDGSGNLQWGNDANAPEGTAVLSTGESGTTKYLRVDGDGTCSWQLAVDATKTTLTGSTNNTITTVTGANAIQGEANLTFDGTTLKVSGGSNTTQAIFSGTGGSGARGLEIVTESVGAADEGVILNARASGTTGRLKFNTNSATAMTILGNGGQVLIGTTTGNTSDRFTIVDPGNAFMSLRSDAEADGNSQVIDFAVGTGDRSSSNLVSSITSAIPTGAGAGGTLKGYLAFSTNSGDSLSERVRIDPDGNVKIGDATTDYTYKLTVSGNGSVNTGMFMHDGSAGTWFGIQTQAANGLVVLRADARSGAYPPLTFNLGGSEKIRIDTSGRLLIGHTATRAISGDNALLQIENPSSGLLSLLRTSNDNGAAWLAIAKSRSSAGAACQAGDQIGGIAFTPHDGTDLNHHAAEIRGFVDTGIGTDDTPGYLAFYTNSGTTTTNERFRITSGDVASFGNSSPKAWQTGGGYYNIQLGNAGYLRADTDASGNFFSYGVNTYRDNSGWKFIGDGRATQISHGIGTDAITFYGSNSGTADGTPTFFEMLKLKVDGDVVCGSGNLVLTDGQGISFAADGNTGGMTSELLDDYEEGTWTPTMATSGGGNLTATYTTQTGTYTKVGRLVYVMFDMAVSNTPTGTAGHPQIRGLPFSPTVGQSTQGGYPIPQFRDSDAMPVDARLYNSSYGHSSSTAIWIQYYNSSGTIQQPAGGTWWAQGRCQGEMVYYAT